MSNEISEDHRRGGKRGMIGKKGLHGMSARRREKSGKRKEEMGLRGLRGGNVT